LVSLYSTIKMMHGPINIRFLTVYCCSPFANMSPVIVWLFLELWDTVYLLVTSEYGFVAVPWEWVSYQMISHNCLKGTEPKIIPRCTVRSFRVVQCDHSALYSAIVPRCTVRSFRVVQCDHSALYSAIIPRCTVRSFRVVQCDRSALYSSMLHFSSDSKRR